jgi:large subunit ribosomal protein L18
VKRKLTPRQRRHRRVRKKIQGTELKPRLAVFRSLRHISAQIIDDSRGHTLCSISTDRKEFSLPGGNCKAAEQLGEEIAQKALGKGIEQVVFDRGGNLYHGRIKCLAEAARKAGLKF